LGFGVGPAVTTRSHGTHPSVNRIVTARSGKVVEVDHPKTRRFKIELVRFQKLAPPKNLCYLVVDFTSE